MILALQIAFGVVLGLYAFGTSFVAIYSYLDYRFERSRKRKADIARMEEEWKKLSDRFHLEPYCLKVKIGKAPTPSIKRRLWSKKWAFCLECGSERNPYHGRGYCRPCYFKQYKRKS